jgi:hypothetical protein
MLFALGAVSSALDALQSLTSQKTSTTQQTGFGHGTANPFSFDSGNSTSSTSSDALSWVNSGNRPQISPETMSALLAAQSQSSTTSTSSPTSRQDALKDLFSQIDADGNGKITKSEFENALGAGGTNLAQADDVFSKLDANSDGNVSLDEMSKALKGAGHHHHGHHAASAGGAGDGSESSTQASGGSTSTTVTNADGSSTTTVKFADGFKMSMTTPGASSSASSPYNWFEQMMQREAQAVSTSTASSAVSMTA